MVKINYYGICHGIGMVFLYNSLKFFLNEIRGLTLNKLAICTLIYIVNSFFIGRIVEVLQSNKSLKTIFIYKNGGHSIFGIIILHPFITCIICYFLNINFYDLFNYIPLIIPIQIFFGRIGNYLKGELIGKKINYLNIRYPSQIQQALTEGVLCGYIGWITYQKNDIFNISTNCVTTYCIVRFINEFVREEDKDMPHFYRKYFRKYGIRWAQALCIIVFLYYKIVFYVIDLSREELNS